MDQRMRTFGEQLGSRALAQDWAGVQQLLAPWLRERYSVEAVQQFFEDDYASVLVGCEIEELHYPAQVRVDGNTSTLEELRQVPSWLPRGRPIPQEVTADNFRQWMNLQLECSEEQAEELELDFLSDTWLIVVELEEGLRVGYWAHDPYEC